MPNANADVAAPDPAGQRAGDADVTRFAARTISIGDRCEMAVDGDVDIDNADDIASLGLVRLTEPTVQTLAIDLHGVTFVDSSGVGTLIRLRAAALKGGKRLILAHPSERVLEVLTLTALDRVFAIDNGHAEAAIS